MRIIQVDAFTTEPYRGNPACVCLLDQEMPTAWMQSLAAEMNLSETAFVRPAAVGLNLRWFTPRSEVRLCGHATLATAHVLWEQGLLTENEVAAFNTKSGLLTAKKVGDWIEMDFPIKPVQPREPHPGLNAALGAEPEATLAAESITVGKSFLLAYDSARTVRDMAPDWAALAATEVPAVIVTAPADEPGHDFVSRFFAPLLGINEDPVTGSAHCYLAPYWAGRLGRDDLVGLQVSSRTGVVRCRPAGERVLLQGQAVTVFVGEMTAQSLR